MSDEQIAKDMLYFNGINGETGGYAIPPTTDVDLYKLIASETAPENLDELRSRHQRDSGFFRGVKEGVDPRNLAEAGWGIIFTHNANPAIKEALSELIELRQEQSGKYFQIYDGVRGYQPGESKQSFLTRCHAGPGPVDPSKVPYYLLIVGGPEVIPYQFQSQLDVQYGVGRIQFDTVEAYANYARSVVRVEMGEVRLPRQAAFFGVTNPDDPATRLSTELMIKPLHEAFKTEKPDWSISAFLGEDARKAQLARLLGGDQTPALLVTAGHGLELGPNNNHRRFYQGALVCSDWPGPYEWIGSRPIPREFFLAGEDLYREACLAGLISFFFACYGGGTPSQDELSSRFFTNRMAPRDLSPFVAHLPSQMLSQPYGGALAVIGHIERAWGYSFRWPGTGTQTTAIQSMLQRLSKGDPVGYAVEYLNERHAELATVLYDELERIRFGKRINAPELAGLWTAHHDARNYTIIGDPAVRLCFAESEANVEQSTIQMASISRSSSVISLSDPETSDYSKLSEVTMKTDSKTDPSADKTNYERPQFSPPDMENFSPPVVLPPHFKKEHPEIYQAYIEHIKAGYRNNDEIFRRILDAFMRSHQATVIMYWTVFVVGLGSIPFKYGLCQANIWLVILNGAQRREESPGRGWRFLAIARNDMR